MYSNIKKKKKKKIFKKVVKNNINQIKGKQA